MLYLVVFFITACVAAAVFLVKINAVVEYIRNDDNDDIAVSFYTLKGIFKYKFEIPLVDFGQKGIKFRLVSEYGKKEKNISEKKDRLKITDIYDKYVSAMINYEANKVLICDIKDYLRTRLVLREFRLDIREGTGNASQTGIICGLLWSFAGVLTSYLSNSFKTYRKCVSINADFNTKVFNVDFHCIFHIKLVHIIMLIIKILLNSIKAKHKIAKEIGGGLSG